MRTMLIPIILVLICSQYVTAISKKYTDCGTPLTYKCFYPTMCLKKDSAPPNLASSRIMEFIILDDVGDPVGDQSTSNNCPVMFRYYAYSLRWVHIEMEFVQELNPGKNTFIFRQLDDQGKIKGEFSCEIDKDKKTKAITRKMKGKSDPLVSKIIADTPGTETDLTKCVFDVRSNDDIFTPNEKIVLEVDTKPTLERKMTLSTEVRCDPAKLKFDPDVKPDKVYSKVAYNLNKPGEYYCDKAEIFKMEFKKRESINKPRSENYTEAKKVECVDNEFIITDEETPATKTKFDAKDPIHIRCVADAKYFCDYNTVKPKDKDKEPLYLTPPNFAKKIPGSLECPKHAKHLIVRGNIVQSPKIECINYEDATYWTLTTSDRTHLLTRSFADAFCTNELNCNQMSKISNLHETVQLDHDGLPKCTDKGELQVNGKAINLPTCDTITGEFKYTFKTDEKKGEQIVGDGSEFFCFLPQERDEETDAANNQLMAITGSVSIIAVVLIVAATNIIVFYISRKRLEALKAKKAQLEKEKRKQNMNDGNFMKFCYTNEEKSALKDGKNIEKLIYTKEKNEEGKLVDVAEYAEADANAKDEAPKSAPHMETGIRWGNGVLDFITKYESRVKVEVVEGTPPDLVIRPEMDPAFQHRDLDNPKEITNPLYKMPELRRVKPDTIIQDAETHFMYLYDQDKKKKKPDSDEPKTDIEILDNVELN